MARAQCEKQHPELTFLSGTRLYQLGEFAAAIEAIREAITKGKNIQTTLVHLSSIKAMLNKILQGYSTKASSILMNVSTGHDDNMRSILREKFELPKDIEIRNWLTERLQNEAKTS